MKIALGSTSIDKANILKEILGEFFKDLEFQTYDVSSGITDQPLDEETTITGAINRAQTIRERNIKSDLFVGLEGGLSLIHNNYFLVCVVALINKKGDLFLGISSKLRLPKEVSEKIKKGERFGNVVREYQHKNKNDSVLYKFTECLINRKKLFSEAISNACAEYRNSSYF
ncbi:MAG: hypothetical protein A3A58_00580 [Candidatus Blackburnbacteria bacterium RIFCSPLOWO2_01_FULL_41_27]|uniref:inosine/xanthosine triphosphatase n=2 Tax=Candidatus Blackburniibacteriota TaxID=1817898 RepID=A0A1G1V9V5_9BACT|nr:MAG: hypothetical protein A3F61_00440 [Candidatus Blackburnbacteria bacterium RIFCSPHIGHO2_12_FULL_41_13b]OGY15014.1 MAG: hypothetical protein A3A58_00580 [Candidatus Blackburnbacteria bacterium RIFCSPLOWO2_01_FULL_41_27]